MTCLKKLCYCFQDIDLSLHWLLLSYLTNADVRLVGQSLRKSFFASTNDFGFLTDFGPGLRLASVSASARSEMRDRSTNCQTLLIRLLYIRFIGSQDHLNKVTVCCNGHNTLVYSIIDRHFEASWFPCLW